MSKTPGRTFAGWFALLFLVACAALIYPVYVIRPFRAQGARELMAALVVLATSDRDGLSFCSR